MADIPQMTKSQNNMSQSTEICSDLPLNVSSCFDFNNKVSTKISPGFHFSSQNNLYSTSGLNILSILFRVSNRANPQIEIGPIDTNCSIVVVDAQKTDLPIVYVNTEFEQLTLYTSEEAIGRNCRFLQSPTGCVTKGSLRRHVDIADVVEMKKNIDEYKEYQGEIKNFKKNGDSFINFCTIIPISKDDGVPQYYVGFLVDLFQQPKNIVKTIEDGSYKYAFSLIDSMNTENPTYSDSFDETEELVKFINEDFKGDATQKWSSIVNQNIDDLAYIIDSKGNLVYATSNTLNFMSPSNGNIKHLNIIDYCHPADKNSFIREIKKSYEKIEFSLISRIKQLQSGNFIYVETMGKCASFTKKKKYVYLCTRIFFQPSLFNSVVRYYSEIKECDFWFKMSKTGIILYSTLNVEKILHYGREELIGTSIQSYVDKESKTKFVELLELNCEETPMNIKLSAQTKDGKKVELDTNLYFYGKSVFCQFRCIEQGLKTTKTTSKRTKLDTIFYEPNTLDMPQNTQITWKVELHNLKMENENLRLYIKEAEKKYIKNKN